MKPWIILVVLAVAITAAVTVAVPLISSESMTGGPDFAAPPKPDGPAPKLLINESLTYDFGTLGQKTKGHHEWTFTNEGPGELEVRGSSTTCSCTTSDLFEGAELKTGKLIHIAPGQSKQITVNWDTKTFENHYRQFVTVGTNDPEHPKIELVVEGNIKLSLVTLPPDSTISFLNVSNDEPVRRHILIASPDRPETKITGFVISNPNLLSAAVRDATAEENAKFKLENVRYIDVTLNPGSNLGEFAEEVVVQTDHPTRKTQSIKVSGRITGPISVIPDKVEIRSATTADGGTQTLTIWSRSRTTVNFTIASKPAGLDIAIEPLPATPGMKGSKYKMTAKLSAGLESGRITGEVVLKTDDPKASEIHVPVDILVKGTI